MSFEQSMKKLEDIISKLEDNELPLEDSISAYREGIQLLDSCRKQIEQAQLLVTVEDVPDKA